MTIEQIIAYLFKMDDKTWRRHANPWSVFTRTSALPLIVLAVWSREWFGWWSLSLIAFSFLWTWLNPRIFRQPKTTDHWASKGVFGERVWLNRKNVAVPERHRNFPNILSFVSAISTLFVVWGVIMLDLWPTIFGIVLVILSKYWFLDRMAWLYEDMKDAYPEYQSWLY